MSYKWDKHSDGSEVAVVRGPRLVEEVKNGMVTVTLPTTLVVISDYVGNVARGTESS